MKNIFTEHSQVLNKSNSLSSSKLVCIVLAAISSTSQIHAQTETLNKEWNAAIELAKKMIIPPQSEISWYRLNDYITKAEAAKYVVKLNWVKSWNCEGNIYTDVNYTIWDLCVDIESLSRKGYLNETWNIFYPSKNITGNELSTMIIHWSDKRDYKECNFDFDMTQSIRRWTVYRIMSCILQSK